ncbi:MAG TPA: MotA/TolQ/ExbB proton channel family protein [Candidatus Omnitrophota bacterium]|nr:MotA/TolQ/ExbB proton channel family protein [Candidatus Omnitrophota bacterium]
MTLLELISTGGFTMVILALCSLISLGIIIERYRYYHKRSKAKRQDFMSNVKREMDRGELNHALRVCETTDTPFAKVAHAGLSLHGHPEREISNNMDRAAIVENNLLERHTGIVGTIGSTAVYIGLFGTVLGIIRAFMDISTSGTGGINVVSKGISESLVCTAAGLIVAVPSVMAYNYFLKRIGDFNTDMELCASEVIDMTVGKNARKS